MRQFSMDRAVEQLEVIYTVIKWILERWRYFPQIYVKHGNHYVDTDIRAILFDLLKQDLADLLSLALQWRLMAEVEGVDVPEEPTSDSQYKNTKSDDEPED